MLRYISALLLLVCLVPAAQAQVLQDLPSSWLGSLQVPGASLRLLINLRQEPNGQLAGSMRSIDQGSPDIPATSVELRGDSLILQVASVTGTYRGKVSGENITGTWAQGGMSFPLNLKKISQDEVTGLIRKPQDPVEPLPYRSEEVTFESAPGVRLAGTLTLPSTAGPHPAVALVTGSGAQDRNETLMGHRPFLVLADYLTRQGFAVLRYDDRGVAQSTGSFATATTKDFAIDAGAAVNYLATRKEIDAKHIGLVGHSEGGIVVPMVAGQNDKLAFAVLLAPPAVNGGEIIYEQLARILRASGVPEETVQNQLGRKQKMFEMLKNIAEAKVPEELRKLAMSEPGANAQAVEVEVREMTSPWFRFFLTYDPAPALRAMKIPVLALIGEKDLQVPADQNVPVIEAAFKASGNKSATVRRLPGLNHLFQTATTGSPNEYATIQETMSPSALQTIAEWMKHIVTS